jgi:hypothetical protein
MLTDEKVTIYMELVRAIDARRVILDRLLGDPRGRLLVLRAAMADEELMERVQSRVRRVGDLKPITCEGVAAEVERLDREQLDIDRSVSVVATDGTVLPLKLTRMNDAEYDELQALKQA